jgi:alpha-beta hydrolase superfamily lysophospholipase
MRTRTPSGWLGAGVLALALSGCAPTIMAPGPGPTAPALLATSIRTDDGEELAMREWLPEGKPKAVILALHGFNDYSNAFTEPATRWAADGIATYAYDQRGFGVNPNAGYWAGTERMVADLDVIAPLVRARHPDVPFYILGESMGGAVVMVAMGSDHPPEADGYILVAPAVRGRAALGPVASGGLWLVAHTIPYAKVTGRNLRIEPSDNIEMLRALSKDPVVIKQTRIDSLYGLVNLMDDALAASPHLKERALIMFGGEEQVVTLAAARDMIGQLPPHAPLTVALYPEGYHMLLRDTHADLAINDVAGWVSDPATPLASGADKLAARELDGATDQAAQR